MSEIRDYRHYAAKRELASKRVAQDAAMRSRHAQFDLQAQDRTAKFERPSFIVVGEGSREANDSYSLGYDRIDWSAA